MICCKRAAIWPVRTVASSACYQQSEFYLSYAQKCKSTGNLRVYSLKDSYYLKLSFEPSSVKNILILVEEYAFEVESYVESASKGRKGHICLSPPKSGLVLYSPFNL